MAKYILALDQGTTGSRAFIFDARGKVVSQSYREFKQYYPKPGWVEHDALEIWESCQKVIREAIAGAKILPSKISAIGITNQRETTVVWDRKTSLPLYRAIVWQCRRTTQLCQTPKLKSVRKLIHQKTGLVLDPYFSATKVQWLFDHVKGIKQKAHQGDVAFGTIDSWLIWKLTGGQSHVTDMTNASRTMLFNIRTKHWDQQLLEIFNVPQSILPAVKESGSDFGATIAIAGLPSGIPITGVMGDQQSALYGQGCFQAGSLKNTYGTGCFLMLNTGNKCVLSKTGLLTTLASDVNGRPVYALEGAVFMAGAVVQWLRDELKIIKSSLDTEKMIKDVKDTNGVYFVPAFTGLGCPYWQADARGVICGLTRGANAHHIIRAALESIAYQTKDVFDIMNKESGVKIQRLKVDGGACRNNFLMQFQADILRTTVSRPKMVDSTVLGVAYLAGVSTGFYKAKDLDRFRGVDAVFTPKMSSMEVSQKYTGWLKAVDKTRE